jgi:CRP-like cAMP-binding protein
MRKVLYILGLLADEDIDWLSANGIRQSVAPGSYIVRQGKPIEALYLLVEGTLVVSVERPVARDFSKLALGEIVGELSFVDSRPASASVRGEGTCLVLRIPRPVLQAKLKGDVRFAARFYQALAIFLAQRLRRQTLGGLGFTGDDLDEESESADELSPEALENLALAGARGDWILQRLKAR